MEYVASDIFTHNARRVKIAGISTAVNEIGRGIRAMATITEEGVRQVLELAKEYMEHTHGKRISIILKLSTEGIAVYAFPQPDAVGQHIGKLTTFDGDGNIFSLHGTPFEIIVVATIINTVHCSMDSMRLVADEATFIFNDKFQRSVRVMVSQLQEKTWILLVVPTGIADDFEAKRAQL